MATKKTKSTKKTNKKGFEHIHQQSRSFYFKFYAEQCGYSAPSASGGTVPISSAPVGIEQLKQTNCIKNLLKNIAEQTPIGKYKVHGACHYTDKMASSESDFWKPSSEKPHGHLLIWLPARASGKESPPVELNTILNYLAQFGLVYRPDVDTDLLLNHGVEKVDLRQKQHYNVIVYHTHETDEAVADGKHRYERDEMFTNLPQSELDEIYNYYFSSISKAGKHDAEYYEKEAYQLGYDTIMTTTEQRTFDDWFYKIPFKQRSESLRRQWEKAYYYGQTSAIEEPNAKKNIRCFIFLNGGGDVGKTYTTQLTLAALGLKTYSVASGKTGKLDNLQPTHKAIDVSDNSIPDLMALADNIKMPAYRRQNHNPVFCGQYLVVSFNGTLDEYLDRFYSDICTDDDRYKPDGTRYAFHTRCFECEVRDSKIYCISPSLRGTEEDITERTRLFLDFVNEFNEQIKTYKPQSIDKLALFKQLTGGQFDDTLKPYTPPSNDMHKCNHPGFPCQHRKDGYCTLALNLHKCPAEK